MKTTSLRLSMLAAGVAIFALTPLAHAAAFSWSAGSGTDLLWTTPANWLPNGAPATTDTALFGVGGTTNSAGPAAVDNILTVSSAIQMLEYTNIAGYHNTLLNPGVTLTVSNTTGAGDALFVGGGGGNIMTTNTILGVGAALVITNSNGNINIRHGSSSTTAFTQNAALDLSGLDNFSASVARLLIAGDGANASTNSREVGTLFLAKTNVIVVSGTAPAINIADNPSNGAGSGNSPTLLTSSLYLGLTNGIFADTITVGRSKCAGQMLFNPIYAGVNLPTAYLRGRTATRISLFAIGDDIGQTTSNQGDQGTVDFTGGVVDLMVNTNYVSRGPAGSGNAGGTVTGILNIGAGKYDVNFLEIAYQQNAGSASPETGTVNLSGGTLLVNTNLELAHFSGTGGTPQGTLNVSNGTVTVQGAITAGLGTSIINFVGGTLNLTNGTVVAGTQAKPVTSFSVSNSVINLAVSAGTTAIEVNGLTINAPATVNIASLPTIGTFPAQFPLIQYLGESGDLTTVAMGSLPTIGGTPYQGYISNNTANLSLDLVVTNGFVPTGVDVWTGTNNANWDQISPNWTLFGVGTAFVNGAIAQFDDSAAGATSVNLTGAVIPSSLTVSNNTKNYIMGGSGSVIGSSSLVKFGTGTLLFTNLGNNSFSGGIFVSNGTVQFGNGGTGGGLLATAQAILDNGHLILDQSVNVAVTNGITGTGNLTLAGTGVVSLSGANAYTGQTLVTGGSVIIDGSVGGLTTSLLTNAPGTTVGGSGSNQGLFNAGGNINPGEVGGIGTFITANGLNLFPGASLTVDLNSTDPTEGSGINDLIQVTGDVNANNTTVAVNIQGGMPQLGMTYPVLTYSGVLNGSFNPVVKSHFPATVDTSIPNQVNVTITGTAGASLKWDSISSSVWDLGGTANWFNLGTSSQDIFEAGDSVLFDDSVAGVQTNIIMAAGVAVYPSAITFNSSANNYILNGAGTISGPATLVKNGTSTLVINTTNSFTGGVTILNGTVMAGTGTALGVNNVSTITNIIASGATFDENGQNMGSATFMVSGAGVGGNGAIINSGPDQSGNDAFQNITLAGDTTFGGPGTAAAGGNSPGRWDMRGGTPTLNCLNGNPYNLTKVGSNQVSLVSVTVDPNLANITIKGGTFGLQGGITSLGNPTNVLTLYPGTLLHCAGFTAPLAKVMVMTNASLDSTGTGANEYDGTVTVQGSNSISTSDPLIFGGVISGGGGLTKAGSSFLYLNASNTYTGNTTINAGTLVLSDPSSISSSPNISLVSGATIDVTLRSDQTFTLASGQIFNDGGAINGSLTNSLGAAFFVGGKGRVATVTASGTVALAGTTYMEVTNNGTLFDSLQAGFVEYGGTLVVSNLDRAHPFTVGQSFQLFNTGGYDGVFANILPVTPGPGLAWDTNSLGSGVLNVIAGPTVPQIASFSLSGSTLLISGTNGTAGRSYRVLSSTNLLTPLNQWVPLTLNSYDSNGNFSFTTNVDTTQPQQFYIISQ